MRIIGGAIILVIAVWLYVVSTRMVNKDKRKIIQAVTETVQAV